MADHGDVRGRMDEDLYNRLKSIQTQLRQLGEMVEDAISAVCAKE